ncbi:hypothetical protein [Variovorax soli]|uniref:hypothetical protein n=1 Tax=Variovorax soli TaxID=376815 RepID=UPI000A774455|nr:hypothetical protein [Variovorax soli]
MDAPTPPKPGRSVVTLPSRTGQNALRVTVPYQLDPTKPEEAKAIALKLAEDNGIDVEDYR